MNYQKILDLKLEEIKNSNKVPTLLLHACCAPCSSYTLEYLSKYFKITIYYYNPNIHPKIEYDRRLEELKKFLTEFKTENDVKLIEAHYDQTKYFDAVKGLESLGEKSKRCYECYKLRMENACQYALKNNFDYFTTTLSISPYKISDWINEIGYDLEKKYMVNYLCADLKKKNGYKRSLELSKEYGLYRQDYCGCIYSKQERDKKYESV